MAEGLLHSLQRSLDRFVTVRLDGRAVVTKEASWPYTPELARFYGDQWVRASNSIVLPIQTPKGHHPLQSTG
jgi:hypothetical protein